MQRGRKPPFLLMHVDMSFPGSDQQLQAGFCYYLEPPPDSKPCIADMASIHEFAEPCAVDTAKTTRPRFGKDHA